jgi:hypothetical protein
MASFTLRLFLPEGIFVGTLRRGGWVGPGAGLRVMKMGIPLPLPRIEPQARSLVTILPERSWFGRDVHVAYVRHISQHC